MNLLKLQGAKFAMDTATGKRSSHLELLMVLGDCICHSRTFPSRPIFPATSFHDVWTFNSFDCVLTDSTRRPRFSEGFLKLSSVYPRCITILKDFSGCFGFVGGVRSENCSVTVEGEFEESCGMAACGIVSFLHERYYIEIPLAANDSPI